MGTYLGFKKKNSQEMGNDQRVGREGSPSAHQHALYTGTHYSPHSRDTKERRKKENAHSQLLWLQLFIPC